MRRPKAEGVTLVELLVVSALVGFIGIAVYSNFSAGMRLWAALQGRTTLEDLSILRLRMDHDLIGAFKYGELLFYGTDDELSFPAGIDAPEALGGERGIGRIGYRHDPAHQLLLRETSDVSALYRESAPLSRPVLQRVTSFKLSYLGFEKTENAYVWQEAWEDKKGEIPKAVRVELSYASPGGTVQESFVCAIPTGGAS